MELSSTYYIKDAHYSFTEIIINDSNPQGVTLTINDTSKDGTQNSFTLPRMEMIEALEYILLKIKAREP